MSLLHRPFRRVGIVNRGEAAVRFLRAARAWSVRRKEPLEVVAFHTHSDRDAVFVRDADAAVSLGDALVPGPDGKLRSAYLDIPRIVRLLKEAGCDAVWPGWGFLSERPEFADACAAAGLVFIGPSGESMRLLGDKIAGKVIAEKHGVPVTPWSGGPVETAEIALSHAERIGYPVLLKAAAGGGGRGIRIVRAREELAPAFDSASNEARAAFGDPTLLVEAFAPEARHVEVQVIADSHGRVHAVGTRDCSMQRRHQKVLEEAPAPGLGHLDEQVRTAAVSVAQASGYTNAGTAEFLVLPDLSAFYFLEMNTRLQVEHPVTECVTGLDLVGLQIDIARGERLPERLPETRGHAIEARLCAEDADEGFRPSAGRLIHFALPHGPGVRVDSGFVEGDVIPSEFDSMLAKVIVHGASRAEAIARLEEALARTTVAIEGGASNRSLLLELAGRKEFAEGTVTTRWLDRYLTERAGPLQRRHLDAALVAASVGELVRTRRGEVSEFVHLAHRGIPASTPQPEPRTFRFAVGGANVSLEVMATGPERYVVSCEGLSVDVGYQVTGQNTAVLRMRGQRLAVVQVVTPTALHLEVEGVAHRLARASDGRVVAPVPAAVTHVQVKVGDLVKQGDRILTLEVMKMEVAVHAPVTGRVGRLLVDTSSRVVAGQALAIIEADAEGAAQGTQGTAQGTASFSPLAAHGSDAALDPQRVLLGAMLGYDFSTYAVNEALGELRSGKWVMTRDRLSTLIDAYVSHELLFERSPGADGVAPLDHFARHLKQPRARGEGLPQPFLARLRAALAWHGVTDLEPTPAQENALLRVLQAHRQLELRDRVLLSALSALVRDDHSDVTDAERVSLRDHLERLAALVIVRDRVLAEAAYSALYLLCDGPRQAEEARELGRQAQEAMARLVAPGASEEAQDAARAELDALPKGALLSLVETMERADRPAREQLLELLVQRLHPDAERAHAVEGVPTATLYWTRGGRVLALLGELPTLVADVAAALQHLGAHDTSAPLDLDVFVPEAECAQVTACEQTFAAKLTEALPAHVRRVSANWGNVEYGRLSRTFERPQNGGAFEEKRFLRNLHPARVEMSEIARLSEFDLELLPSPGEVVLALARAKQDPSDERLVCIVEVERVDPVRDASGRVLRVPSFERVFLTALNAMREVQRRRGADKKLYWNRIVLFVRPQLPLTRDEIESMAERLTAPTLGLALEKVVLRVRAPSKSVPGGKPMLIEWTNPTGHGAAITYGEPVSRPVRALSAYERRVVEAHRKGLFYPYELVRALSRENKVGPFPQGRFVELDLDPTGTQLQPVSRPYGQNEANLVVGLVTNVFAPFHDGLRRVLIVGDPTRGMGSLAEPECRRILAAFDLAEQEGLAVEWVAISSGAKIAMDSGTENLDWTAKVLSRIIRFTQAGGVVNVIVDGINVGAQSYWNAEATMLMHCKGALIMTPQGSMLLTGKKALEFAGSVAAEDNNGIGGFERIMGPNGQAQYFAPDLVSAYEVLFRHLSLTQLAPGEGRPRRLQSADPLTRDVTLAPYTGGESDGYRTVGEVFDEATNPGRKRPFAIRPVMRAVLDQDVEPLERWASWQGAESAVVWEGRLGGDPVCCIGIESRPLPRRGELPADGPDQWTSGTLFPLSSKKVARAINAASGVRPVVVLANLSGFDGSPDSLRHLQLEYGAEIGRAVVNFQGPLVFCVVARYHGGAYVVFSQALNPTLEAVALEGSYASVIGGGPAAAVVFPGLVRKRALAEASVVQARKALDGASPSARAAATAEYERVLQEATAKAQGQVAREFDAIHTVARAREKGSLSDVIGPNRLRPYLVARIRGESLQEIEALATELAAVPVVAEKKDRNAKVLAS